MGRKKNNFSRPNPNPTCKTYHRFFIGFLLHLSFSHSVANTLGIQSHLTPDIIWVADIMKGCAGNHYVTMLHKNVKQFVSITAKPPSLAHSHGSNSDEYAYSFEGHSSQGVHSKLTRFPTTHVKSCSSMPPPMQPGPGFQYGFPHQAADNVTASKLPHFSR